MDLKELLVGDIVYGLIPKYNPMFLTGYIIKECKVVRVSKWNIWLEFDSYTKKEPQRMRKGLSNTIYKTRVETAKALLAHVNSGKHQYHKSLSDKIKRYCNRIVKSDEKVN